MKLSVKPLLYNGVAFFYVYLYILSFVPILFLCTVSFWTISIVGIGDAVKVWCSGLGAALFVGDLERLSGGGRGQHPWHLLFLVLLI